MSTAQFPPPGPSAPTSTPDRKKPLHKRWWVWLLGVVGLLLVIGLLSGEDPAEPDAPRAAEASTSSSAAPPPPEAAPEAAPEPPPAPSPAAPPPAPEFSVSQQNALDAAQQYLDVIGGFSRDGLIQQLTVGSGFSTEDATWAVDRLNIDYNEQAAEAARNYQDIIGGFSRSGMIQQLMVGSGFTQAQAEYGADAVGL